VRTICFDLGVSYDNLGGDTKLARIISLLERLERREQGANLVAWLRENRSDVVWPDPYNVLVIELPFHYELVRVPVGVFLMGSDGRKDRDAYDDEKPQHRVHLPEFFIGKHPVTVEQFAAFAEASGHRTTAEQAGFGVVWENHRWNKVEGANWRHPAGPQSDVIKKADHPVTQVSWHDAVAFCLWLNEATGRTFRLPTEAEWEKAARGTDGRLYPWGNTAPDERLCNFGNKVGDTPPVGEYPAGASPYGALDMAGNVWEWTTKLIPR
jgi:formylglycine-generating enzyme